MKRKATEADKPEKKLRWDVPKTASLINFYKEHPELWNPRVPEYSNDKLRLKAVEQWLLENQLDPEKDLINEVKLKLHGLRTSYGHELKMEATKKIDGQPYISKWQWYRQLSFLKEAMCFRSRSGSVSSSVAHANGSRSRLTRRRGRRGQPQDLSGTVSADDMDNISHSDSYYVNDHDGNDVKIVAVEHSGDNNSGNGGPVHAYSMIEAEYDHHPPPPHAHHASTSQNAHHHHPGHHSQLHHPGLVHMVHMEDSPHPHHLSANSSSGGGGGAPSEHMQTPQDPHVPVVTYRAREPIVPTASSTITRHDSASNLHLMCLASTSSSSTPDKQQQVGEDLTTSRTIPPACNCRCRSAAQSTGERLGRLVEETFSNLHPEYHEMARWEIQQILGKYLQKPLP